MIDKITVSTIIVAGIKELTCAKKLKDRGIEAPTHASYFPFIETLSCSSPLNSVPVRAQGL